MEGRILKRRNSLVRIDDGVNEKEVFTFFDVIPLN